MHERQRDQRRDARGRRDAEAGGREPRRVGDARDSPLVGRTRTAVASEASGPRTRGRSGRVRARGPTAMTRTASAGVTVTATTMETAIPRANARAIGRRNVAVSPVAMSSGTTQARAATPAPASAPRSSPHAAATPRATRVTLFWPALGRVGGVRPEPGRDRLRGARRLGDDEAEREQQAERDERVERVAEQRDQRGRGDERQRDAGQGGERQAQRQQQGEQRHRHQDARR